MDFDLSHRTGSFVSFRVAQSYTGLTGARKRAVIAVTLPGK
jgi:hypothetical protein